ncbi:MAG: cupin domain-containing protein [Candidatus Nitrosocosmicus sp.]|nr:cupin domain-containing protein [Candidatus Nitrosocosmicus sp.]MDN5868131.1 cupin domain-containing protein [Candidatus Nitrosocosmicus sp.]
MNNSQNTLNRTFDLDNAEPEFSNLLGSISSMNVNNFPILSGMGASLLRLKEGGVNEPHWHTNAAELNYCIAGKAEITIYGNNAHKDAFIINPGQLTFIPTGYWHDVQSIGEEGLKLVMVYDNDNPQYLGISGSVGSLPTRVLNSIFGLTSPAFFDQLNYQLPKDVIFGSNKINITEQNNNSNNNGNDVDNTSNPYSLNLGNMDPQIKTNGGNARLGSIPFFPILRGLSVFVIDLKPKGIIEPHTHPNAGELNYVIDGKVRFTAYGPNGEIGTSEIHKGQVFFVPAGYFHYLENSDDSNSGTVASFFSNENPEFIGMVGGLSSYSDKVLGTVFTKAPDFFSALPRQIKNVLIAAGTEKSG